METKYVIFNNSSKTYFGRRDGKYGFYKDPQDEAVYFKELSAANFVAQILYDVRGYKSLVVKELIPKD